MEPGSRPGPWGPGPLLLPPPELLVPGRKVHTSGSTSSGRGREEVCHSFSSQQQMPAPC